MRASSNVNAMHSPGLGALLSKGATYYCSHSHVLYDVLYKMRISKRTWDHSQQPLADITCRVVNNFDILQAEIDPGGDSLTNQISHWTERQSTPGRTGCCS